MSMIPGFTPLSMSAQLAIKLGPPQFPRLFRAQGMHFHQRKGAARRWLQTATDSSPFAYTWLTRTPDRITPDDVLSSFPPTSSSLVESGEIPILLVTPSFAHWINPDSPFLDRWMNRLYQNPTTPESRAPIHAVLAVVDRLPDVRPQADVARGNADAGNALLESEGLSLTFAKTENIMAKTAALRRIRTMGIDEASLVFSIETSVPDMPGQSVRRPVHEVGLRLANTIFVNGNETTLLGARWTYDSTAKKYIFDQSLSLSSCVVKNSTKSLQSSFAIPLYPVSQRRKVISSMGNILRQVAKYADGRSNEPMPASSELEKELPRYIAEHNIADQRVSVWALVEKSGGETPLEVASTQDRLIKSIQAGGKLHRVMSGGGGWGKKQGLLSLDPEISFLEPGDYERLSSVDLLFSPNGATSAHELSTPFDESLATMDDLSSLSQVAEPGDYVQFFVSIEPCQLQAGHTTLPELPEGSISYHFGVLSDSQLPITESATRKDLIAVPRYFGALTEKAITYLQPKITPRSKGGVLGTTTKCDIPGSRVEMTLA